MRLIAEQEHWTINYTIGAVSYSYYQQKFVFVYLRFLTLKKIYFSHMEIHI